MEKNSKYSDTFAKGLKTGYQVIELKTKHPRKRRKGCAFLKIITVTTFFEWITRTIAGPNVFQ